MGVAVLLILVGAGLIVLIIVAIAGIIVEGKRNGVEAEPATPDIWTKIVDWILKKLDFLIDKVLKGSVTALGLILVILGAVHAIRRIQPSGRAAPVARRAPRPGRHIARERTGLGAGGRRTASLSPASL